MKYIPAAVLFCFLAVISFAQQPKPIIVEGKYSAGSSSVQPYESIEMKQKLAEALNNISAAFRNSDYDYIIETAQSLLDRHVEDPRLFTSLALAYEGKADYDNAKWFAEQAIAKRPSNTEAYTTLAYVWYKKNDMMRAREYIDTALRLNPKSQRAKEVKDIIEVGSVAVKKPRVNSRNASTWNMPDWFIIYFICVIVVAFAFLIMRYRGLRKGAIDEQGRHLREVNIKEQYNFIRPIGEGGMGKVYEAYDNVLKRKVAVKRIRPELLRNTYVRDQFLAEARMVAMLHHPCIVEIYTVIETTNSLYLVFEYVEGQTLETRLDIDSFLTFPEAKEIFGSVCKGLSYAHSNNIVHCDLKPGNIMISDSGVAKVMDFGVAKKITEDEAGGTRTVAGTPAYMSPEQQKGFMTKQSDIYSLAVCIYEALVGQVPWSLKDFDITTKKIVPPSEVSPGIPKSIDRLIEVSLNDDPSKRIQSVDEFWDIFKNA